MSASLPDDPAVAEAGNDWRWLSPRSLIVRPVTDLIRLLPVLAGLLIFGSARGGGGYWGFSFAGLAIVTSIVRYSTTRYRITAERVYLRHGLLNQKVLSVPRDRIRSVDLSAHVVYRILGLRKVQVGTGRSDRHDDHLHLDALTLADAEMLRAALLGGVAAIPASAAVPGAAQAPAPETPASAAVSGAGPLADRPLADRPLADRPLADRPLADRPLADRELARLRLGWLRFAPLTGTGLVIAGVVTGSVAQALDAAHVNVTAIGPVYRMGVRFSALSPAQQVLEGALAVLAVLLVLSVAGYIALFWNFRLVNQGGAALRVSRGLLSTRTTTIDTARLRGAELSEPLLLRAAGGARCMAITTGLRVGRGAEHGGSVLLPPAPSQVARDVAAAVIGTTAEPFACELIRHGPAAQRRRYTRAIGGACVLIAATAGASWIWNATAWILLSSLILLPIAAALAADRYHSLGHRLADGWLITRTGTLVRRRCVLSTDGIIGWRIHQSWFQRRQGLVSLAATTAAGRQHYVAHDIPEKAAVALATAATGRLLTPLRTDDA